jgi:hypothetical protein
MAEPSSGKLDIRDTNAGALEDASDTSDASRDRDVSRDVGEAIRGDFMDEVDEEEMESGGSVLVS